MVTKYTDVIKIRKGKAAYNIAEEREGEWSSFVPNKQFNDVLHTVLKSVRGNDVDYHKSFWINGTYGTGKSHAVSVICHLLCDAVDNIKEWVDYEYKSEKFATLRNSIYSLRECKRLFPITIYGLNAMTHVADLALVLQKSVKETLSRKGIDIHVQTDFEAYANQINGNPEMWDNLIQTQKELSTIAENRNQLVEKLNAQDLGTYHRVRGVLRGMGLDVRMNNDSIKQWLLDIQGKLRDMGICDGLFIIWDEFTDVLSDSGVGLQVIKALQEIAEIFMDVKNDSCLFLISHPSAFDRLSTEQLKQTDGRYHRMKYNMESVSAFKIMSHKFEVIDTDLHKKLREEFYQANPELLEMFTRSSNDRISTAEDLYNLFPLHPGTANLATHYATVIGSSSRSVFEFLGQNDAIRAFLENEDFFSKRDTITADYLWDYVLKVFQEDVTNYGAVTERFNSYISYVEEQGETYTAVFKGILLLNAFNNLSAENNNGLVTPTEENIFNLFKGSRHKNMVDEVLQWFNEKGVIQRAPSGLYSIQFSSLPASEIEEKKSELRAVDFKYTSKILEFTGDVTKSFVEKRLLSKVIRPYVFKFFSRNDNDSSLRVQIKNARKQIKSSYLFFAFLVSRNNDELAELRTFAEFCAADREDKELENIIFVLVDEVFTDKNYERFIEYQANCSCAGMHGFLDQAAVHKDHASTMVREWLDTIQTNNAIIYIKGTDKKAISMRHLSRAVNSDVIPYIFPYAPDSYETLRQKAPDTFWKEQKSKEIVRLFIFAKAKEEFRDINSQMRPIQYLIDDCLDDNMEWKSTIPEKHPMKMVYDKVDDIISASDKSLLFNFAEKFEMLTKPPFGLYSNYASMGIMAFALKRWADKIFDPQGKPRDANGLCDDIVTLFKAWDDNRNKDKLNFKFQTPEEVRLCTELISLFGLNQKGNAYANVSSLNDARYAITSDFLEKKGAPLWAVKYAPYSAFPGPGEFRITEKLKQLADCIVKICNPQELRNPSLVNETLSLIDVVRVEMKNILNVDAAFSEGFKAYLMQLNSVNAVEDEVESLCDYIRHHLEGSVGLWTEDEVKNKALEWAASQRTHTTPTPDSPDGNGEKPLSIKPTINKVSEKIARAKGRVENLDNLADAKRLLYRICEQGDEYILEIIME